MKFYAIAPVGVIFAAGQTINKIDTHDIPTMIFNAVIIVYLLILGRDIFKK